MRVSRVAKSGGRVTSEKPKKAKEPGKAKSGRGKKRRREALEASEVRYRRLFETAQDGILILDAETGKIDDVNPFLVEMLGYSFEEFLGKRLWEIGPFKDVEASKIAFQQLQRERYIRYKDLPLKTKEGCVVDVEFVSNVYEVDHKKVIQCNIREITDRKRAEEEVRRSRNELEFYNDLMTHDLSNINQVTLGYLEILSGTELSEQQRKFLDTAVRSTQRNAKLIENVKKIWKGKEAALGPVDLNKCIVDAVEEILAPSQETVKINYTPRPCRVVANDLLKDAVINLLDNAAKFDSSSPAVIDVSVSDLGERCRLSIADRGKGIPDEYKRKIFSRLERLDKNVRGTGLGLHLVQTIVQSCGGEIWVEDRLEEGVPVGSIFNVLLRKAK